MDQPGEVCSGQVWKAVCCSTSLLSPSLILPFPGFFSSAQLCPPVCSFLLDGFMCVGILPLVSFQYFSGEIKLYLFEKEEPYSCVFA